MRNIYLGGTVNVLTSIGGQSHIRFKKTAKFRITNVKQKEKKKRIKKIITIRNKKKEKFEKRTNSDR